MKIMYVRMSGRVNDWHYHSFLCNSMCFLKDVTLPDYKTNYKTINDLFQVFQPGGEGGREKEEKMSKNLYIYKQIFVPKFLRILSRTFYPFVFILHRSLDTYYIYLIQNKLIILQLKYILNSCIASGLRKR